MLIHPWDAALDDDEWRRWIADGHDFGQLVVNGADGAPPSVVPTHFVGVASHLLVHLARPNPVWAAIEADPLVVLSVIDDYAFVPAPWRALQTGPDSRPEDGVPTSYYAAVQFVCRAEIIDDPTAKADLLRRQLAHFQPAGDHGDVAVGLEPYGRLLAGIRGLRLHIEQVRAKFKYDDKHPGELRERVAHNLSARGLGRDSGAAAQQRRRTIADAWPPR